MKEQFHLPRAQGLIKESLVENVAGPACRRALSTSCRSQTIASEGLRFGLSHSEPFSRNPQNCVQQGYLGLHRAEPNSLLLGVVFAACRMGREAPPSFPAAAYLNSKEAQISLSTMLSQSPALTLLSPMEASLGI